MSRGSFVGGGGGETPEEAPSGTESADRMRLPEVFENDLFMTYGDEASHRQRGMSCWLARNLLTFLPTGLPAPKAFVLSSAVWVVSRVRSRLGFALRIFLSLRSLNLFVPLFPFP